MDTRKQELDGFLLHTVLQKAIHLTDNVLRKYPLHQVIFILKMVVKGWSDQSRLIGDHADRNFIKGMLLQKALEAFSNQLLCQIFLLFHSFSPLSNPDFS